MALKDQITAGVKKILADAWTTRDGTVVPENTDIGLGNDGINLEGTVLYADLAGSTRMVDAKSREFAAEVYKSYLYCAAQLIQSEDGVITAYDGDRVMAVFVGTSKNTSAVRCGLKINWAVQKVINPAIMSQYPGTTFRVRQIVGIDTGKLLVARTGVRGANDLVWVGPAANYAAKLNDLSADFPTWITGRVYDNMHGKVRLTNGRSMWEKRTWATENNLSIYRSTWTWPVG